jgi:hypothetical protein
MYHRQNSFELKFRSIVLAFTKLVTDLVYKYLSWLSFNGRARKISGNIFRCIHHIHETHVKPQLQNQQCRPRWHGVWQATFLSNFEKMPVHWQNYATFKTKHGNAGHTARMGEERDPYRILVGKFGRIYECVGLYIHFPIRLHCVVLNESPGATLPSYI